MSVLFLVVASLLLCAVALWLWGLWGLVRRARRTRMWPHAVARVISKERWGKRDVNFELPDGRQVTTRMIMDMALVRDRSYLVGELVMVAYDPREPSRAEQVLSRKDLSARLAAETASFAIFVAILVWSQWSR